MAVGFPNSHRSRTKDILSGHLHDRPRHCNIDDKRRMQGPRWLTQSIMFGGWRWKAHIPHAVLPYFIAIVGKKRLRRLHRRGGCGTDPAELHEVEWVETLQGAVYDFSCKHCWRKEACPTDIHACEANSSSRESSSSNSSSSS